MRPILEAVVSPIRKFGLDSYNSQQSNKTRCKLQSRTHYERTMRSHDRKDEELGRLCQKQFGTGLRQFKQI